jgi:hypothetical protein
MPRKPTGCAAKAAAESAVRTQELFDYAVSKPGGFTIHEVMAALSWSRGTTDTAIRNLRRNHRHDSITLLMSQGYDESRYSLAGRSDLSPWATQRLMTAEKNLETLMWVCETAGYGLQAGSTEDKRATLIKTHVGRLLEDLANMRDQQISLF